MPFCSFCRVTRVSTTLSSPYSPWNSRCRSLFLPLVILSVMSYVRVSARSESL